MTIRVLTISKPYVASAYRDKIRLMAQDSRFEVGLICPEDWAGQTFETDDNECKDPYFCRQLPIRLNGKNHFHFYRGLKRAIEQFRPHVVNVEEEHYSFVTYQAYRAALAIGAKPLFYTWQNIHKNYPPPFSWIEQFVFRHSMAAVVGNDEAGAILRAKGYKGRMEKLPQMGVNENLFPVVYLSHEEKQQRKIKVGLDTTIPWVLFCGRFVEEKGIPTLFAACDKIGEKNQRCGIVLLGNGPETQKLQEAAKKVHKNVTIQFVPFIPSHQVPDWMAAADFLCLPSLTRSNWKEQFGRVLVEAMASSTVVVGSSSGEIPLVIGDAGVVFTENNAFELSEKLSRLFSDRALLESYKVLGLKRAQENFTNQVIASRLCDLIWEEVKEF